VSARSRSDPVMCEEWRDTCMSVRIIHEPAPEICNNRRWPRRAFCHEDTKTRRRHDAAARHSGMNDDRLRRGACAAGPAHGHARPYTNRRTCAQRFVYGRGWPCGRRFAPHVEADRRVPIALLRVFVSSWQQTVRESSGLVVRSGPAPMSTSSKGDRQTRGLSAVQSRLSPPVR
jgi:hypothetical protein